MNKKVSNIFLVLILLVGIVVLAYPSVADYWNSFTQSRQIVNYEKIVSQMNEEDYDELFERANQYNQDLYKLNYPLLYYENIKGYEDCLNLSGDGLMGYITIDKIKLQLPIYHGTDESVLNVAIGHLQGSSLPIGGENTHTILSGHRGLPSAKLFTDLGSLDVGDSFVITIANRTITYKVDNISIVLPDEVDGLDIIPGGDYCTLVTCTPYGVNTHRLLVRGVRVANFESKPAIYVSSDAYLMDPVLIAPIIAVPILLGLLIVLLVKYRKRR